MKLFILLTTILIASCNSNKVKSLNKINIDLKRGATISCGPQEGEMFGSVSFDATIPQQLQKDFNTGIALLHSFEYDEAEKMFAKVIDEAPDCAMAYWGVAMSNFHPVWVPPSLSELQKGIQVIQVARSIKNKTRRDHAESSWLHKVTGDRTARLQLIFRRSVRSRLRRHTEPPVRS